MSLRSIGYVPRTVSNGVGVCSVHDVYCRDFTGPFGGQGVYEVHVENNNDTFVEALNQTQIARTSISNGLAQRVFLKDTVCNFDFTNVYNVPCNVTWYVCRPRENIPGGSGGTPVALWNLGNSVDDGADVSGNYRSTPFNSTPFTRAYRVVKVKKFRLGAGAQKSMTFRRKINAYYDASNGYNTYRYKSQTYCHMIVISGCIDRQASAVAPTGRTGISACQIGMVITTRLDYYPVQTTFRSQGVGTYDPLTIGITSECAVDPNLGLARVPFPVLNGASTGSADNTQKVFTKEIP